MKLSGIHHACEWRETIRLMMFWDLFCIYWIMKISLEEFLHKFNTTFPPAIVGIPTHCVVDRYYLWSTIPKAVWQLCDWYGFTKQANILWFDRGGWREGGGGFISCPPAVNILKMLIVWTSIKIISFSSWGGTSTYIMILCGRSR